MRLRLVRARGKWWGGPWGSPHQLGGIPSLGLDSVALGFSLPTAKTKGMAPKGEPDEPAWIQEAYKKR